MASILIERYFTSSAKNIEDVGEMKIRVCKTMICFSLVRNTYFSDFLGNRS